VALAIAHIILICLDTNSFLIMTGETNSIAKLSELELSSIGHGTWISCFLFPFTPEGDVRSNQLLGLCETKLFRTSKA